MKGRGQKSASKKPPMQLSRLVAMLLAILALASANDLILEVPDASVSDVVQDLFSRDVLVQTRALRQLATQLVAHTLGPAARDSQRELILNLGGLDAVIAVLNAHGDKEIVVENGATVLGR
jgi:hypothetical protein